MAARPEIVERGNFTLGEFLKWSGIGKTHAYSEIKAGRLLAMKCGQRTLVRIEDAESWRASLPRLNTIPAPQKT